MKTQEIGVREFQDKLATYPTALDAPLAIISHGDTIGFFFPAPRKHTGAEWIALREASERWQQVLADNGIGEEEYLADFERFRKEERR